MKVKSDGAIAQLLHELKSVMCIIDLFAVSFYYIYFKTIFTFLWILWNVLHMFLLSWK